MVQLTYKVMSTHVSLTSNSGVTRVGLACNSRDLA